MHSKNAVSYRRLECNNCMVVCSTIHQNLEVYQSIRTILQRKWDDAERETQILWNSSPELLTYYSVAFLPDPVLSNASSRRTFPHKTQTTRNREAFQKSDILTQLTPGREGWTTNLTLETAKKKIEPTHLSVVQQSLLRGDRTAPLGSKLTRR